VEDPNLSFSNSKLGHKREVIICPEIQPNTAKKFTHRWSSRNPNDIKFGGWKAKTIYNNFHGTTCFNSNVTNDISSRQELEGYPPRPLEALLSIWAISRAVLMQMLWNVMGAKRRWLPTTFMKNTLPNCDYINVISSSENAWVLLSTKSTKSMATTSIINYQMNNFEF